MMSTVDLSTVKAGFSDPILDSQATFRKLLDALSRPGRIAHLDVLETPAPLNAGSAAIVLCLIDYDTPLFLSESLRTSEVLNWIRFHCGAPLTETPIEASFAILDQADTWPALTEFNLGDPKYPDAGASLILQIASLEGGKPVTLTGPGIETEEVISPNGLPDAFWTQRAEAVRAFQLGVDCYLTSDHTLVGLPRTTRCTIE